MTVKLSPIGNDAPFIDSSGNPLSGGLLYSYTAGSATPETTYTTQGGSTANANPVVLNSGGYPASGGNVVEIWLTAAVNYKFTLKTSAGVEVWTRDQISGINDTTTSLNEWVSGPAPTYVSATSFTLVGDQTSTFQVGRRVKTTNTGGTVYSTITASTFGAVTTVVVSNDSGTLDSGLSAVSYSLLSKSNDAMPRGVFPVIVDVLSSIWGLTYSNNVADATNDIDVAAGRCVDTTGGGVITVAATTKRSDAAWAVGTGQGALDTGTVGNSDYYIWAIKRVDTQVTDILFSLSSTAPTMPANYTLKRLIGWFKRVGDTIVAFHTYEIEGGGLELRWDAPTGDIALAGTLTTSRRTDAVKVPLNFSVIALLNVSVYDAASAFAASIVCPDQTDVAPAIGTGYGANIFQATTTAGDGSNVRSMEVRTSATGTIAARADLATVDQYLVWTVGFRWGRRVVP